MLRILARWIRENIDWPVKLVNLHCFGDFDEYPLFDGGAVEVNQLAIRQEVFSNELTEIGHRPKYNYFTNEINILLYCDASREGERGRRPTERGKRERREFCELSSNPQPKILQFSRPTRRFVTGADRGRDEGATVTVCVFTLRAQQRGRARIRANNTP